jgi:hypothetical protein
VCLNYFCASAIKIKEFNIIEPAHSSVVFTYADELTNAYKATMKATKENIKGISLYAIALQQLKLLRILTNAKTEAWPGREA